MPDSTSSTFEIRLLILVVLGFGLLPGETRGDDASAVTALNKWWQDFTYASPPVKAGAVTPAHSITSRTGHVYNVPKHVQSQEEADDEAADARYMQHKRALVRGFNISGQTVTVLTNLRRNPIDISDAQELCHNLGAFVWANPYRQFGLQNIEVAGANGELLSFRKGLGKVH